MRTLDWVREATQDYLQNGLSQAEIGVKYGRSKDAVYKALRKVGAKDEAANIAKKRGGRKKLEDMAKISHS